MSFLSSTLPSRKTSKHFSLAEGRIKCSGRNIEGGNIHGEKRIGKSDRSCGPSTTANGCPLVVAAPIQLYIQFLNNFVLDYELTNSISDRVSVQSCPIYHSSHLVSHLWFPNFYRCKQIQSQIRKKYFSFFPVTRVKIITGRMLRCCNDRYILIGRETIREKGEKVRNKILPRNHGTNNKLMDPLLFSLSTINLTKH